MSCVQPSYAPANVLDYPRGDPGRAKDVAESLISAGVEEVCLDGPSLLPGGYRVLGRGHAAVVLRARLRGVGDVAVKIRRADSKRESLMLECAALRAAWPVAPRVYRCTDEFIVMDLVLGAPVDDLARSIRGCERVLSLIAKLAEAARWLDRAGVCHEELSDLRGHAFIVGSAVKFIDFESASMRYCCDVCKVMSWALYRSGMWHACPALVVARDAVREALREYKSSPSTRSFTRLVLALREAIL